MMTHREEILLQCRGIEFCKGSDSDGCLIEFRSALQLNYIDPVKNNINLLVVAGRILTLPPAPSPGPNGE